MTFKKHKTLSNPVIGIYLTQRSSYESIGGLRTFPNGSIGGANAGFPLAINDVRYSNKGVTAEQSKRTMSLSYAIMTLALLSASASQLRYFVAYSQAHSYPIMNYFLICSCLFIEVSYYSSHL